MKYLFSIILLMITAFGSLAQNFNALLAKAKNGMVSAQIELAKCYLDGEYVDQSQLQAVKWFEKAAEKGSLEAMVACGDLYCDEWNIDLEPDYVKGINWYRKAARKGNAKSKDFIENFKIIQEDIDRDCPFVWLPCDEDFERYSTLKDNIDIINKGCDNKNPIASYYMAIISYIDKDFPKAVN